MDFSELVLDSVRSDNPINSNMGGDTGEPKHVSDFLTIQSLSFPVVAGAVGIGWNVLQKAFVADWTKSGLVPIVLSAIVVLALWLQAYTDLTSGSKRGAALLIGVINTLLLAAGALGVSTVIGPPA